MSLKPNISKPIQFLDSDYSLVFGSRQDKQAFIDKLLSTTDLEYPLATASVPYKEGKVAEVSYDYPILLDLSEIEKVPRASESRVLRIQLQNKHYRYNWDNAGTNKDEIEQVELIDGDWVHVDREDPVEEKLNSLQIDD